MAEQIALEELQSALSHPNKAIQKRILAIIFKEEVIEAEDLVRQFVQRESDTELQALGGKVLQKLREYQAFSDSMEPEMSIPLLKSPGAETRIRGLRRLIKKKTPTIAPLLQQYCPQEKDPIAGYLIMVLLNNNPHHGNLPIILGFLGSPSVGLRKEAFKGLHIFVNGALLPMFFRGLVDISSDIQMMTLQMVNQFQRQYLLTALEQMMSGPPEISQLASKVLSTLSGADLLPLLKRHLSHSDKTTALFLQTFYNHIGGGTPAAEPSASVAAAVPQAAPPKPKPGPTPEQVRAARRAKLFVSLIEAVRQGWATAPVLFIEPLRLKTPPRTPHEFLDVIRGVFDRLRFVLTISSICLYFRKGNRLPAADRMCFRAIQRGILSIDTLQLLQTLAPAFPEPAGSGDLFPLVISKLFRQDEGFFEPFLSIQEGLGFIADNPTETEKFLPAAIESLAEVLKSFSGPLKANRLLVRQVVPTGARIVDALCCPPAVIDPKTVESLDLTHRFGVLVSHDSLNTISLEPFLRATDSPEALEFGTLDESTLLAFLGKYEVKQAYISFLSEAAADA
jgi:hypothetical protein